MRELIITEEFRDFCEYLKIEAFPKIEENTGCK